MCGERYAKFVANQTDRLIDIMLFSLVSISFITLFVFDKEFIKLVILRKIILEQLFLFCFGYLHLVR